MARTRRQRRTQSPTPPPSDLTSGVVDGLGYKVEFWGSRQNETGDTHTVYIRWVEGNRCEGDELRRCSLPGKQSEHTLRQIEAGLESGSVPLLTVAEPWDDEEAAEAEADGTGIPVHEKFYLKRPWISDLQEPFDDITQAVSPEISYHFAFKIAALERLARHPQHPNIVRYHGCRVRQGRVTGILLHRVKGMTLAEHIAAGKPIDNESFMATATSAVQHLHNVVGMAHNDIQSSNIMVSPDGTTATIIDFGSAELFGKSLYNRGFSCIGQDPLDMHAATLYVDTESTPGRRWAISRKYRDLATLERLRTWLENPSFLELANGRWAWMEGMNAELREEHAQNDANGNREPTKQRYDLRSRRRPRLGGR